MCCVKEKEGVFISNPERIPCKRKASTYRDQNLIKRRGIAKNNSFEYICIFSVYIYICTESLRSYVQSQLLLLNTIESFTGKRKMNALF